MGKRTLCLRLTSISVLCFISRTEWMSSSQWTASVHLGSLLRSRAVDKDGRVCSLSTAGLQGVVANFNQLAVHLHGKWIWEVLTRGAVWCESGASIDTYNKLGCACKQEIIIKRISIIVWGTETSGVQLLMVGLKHEWVNATMEGKRRVWKTCFLCSVSSDFYLDF